jgi:hypothetical protein
MGDRCGTLMGDRLLPVWVGELPANDTSVGCSVNSSRIRNSSGNCLSSCIVDVDAATAFTSASHLRC